MNIRRLYEDLLEGLVNLVARKADDLADKVVRIQMGHRWVVAYSHRDPGVRLVCTCGQAQVMQGNKVFILVKGVIGQGSLQIIEIKGAKSLHDAIESLKYDSVGPYKHHD